MSLNLSIANETSTLKTVVLGISTDKGEAVPINPMMYKHLRDQTYPTEESSVREVATFEKVLTENGVTVLRPENISGTEQTFARDIGFTIDDYFFISNMRHPSRSVEINGIQHILDQIDSHKIIHFPNDVLIEGGDVIVWNDHIFVGIGDRTNIKGVEFLQNFFPNKNVVGVPIVVDHDDADNNILHLDCCFQPIGTDEAIIYKEGFVSIPKEITNLFPDNKLIQVSLEEKNLMFPNIFSISPKKIVVERNFHRLKEELTSRGYEVLDVDYSENAKLSGLLRCSTLPLRRE